MCTLVVVFSLQIFLIFVLCSVLCQGPPSRAKQQGNPPPSTGCGGRIGRALASHVGQREEVPSQVKPITSKN